MNFSNKYNFSTNNFLYKVLLDERENPFYEKIKRLFKLIYDDILYENFEFQKKELEELREKGKIDYSSYSKKTGQIDSNEEEIKKNFINGDDGILKLFSDLLKEEDKRFITEFFKRIDPIFQMLDNHLYEDFYIPTLVLNIYSYLYLYKKYHNDFNTFLKKLDNYTIISNLNFSKFNNELSKRKEILKLIIDFDNFYKYGKEEEIIKENIFGDRYGKEKDIILGSLKLLIELDQQKENMLRNGKNYDSIDIDDLSDLYVRGIFGEKQYFRYNEAVMINGRLKYLINAINEACPKHEMRKEIYEMFLAVKPDYFNKIISTGDSFKQIVDYILDSDTYFELEKKLMGLKSYSFDGKRIDIEKLKEELDDDKYKLVYQGQIITYINDSLNMVEKPKQISERTSEAMKSLFKPESHFRIKYLTNTNNGANSIAKYHQMMIKGLDDLKRQEIADEAKKRVILEVATEVEETSEPQEVSFKGNHQIEEENKEDNPPQKTKGGLFSRWKN